MKKSRRDVKRTPLLLFMGSRYCIPRYSRPHAGWQFIIFLSGLPASKIDVVQLTPEKGKPKETDEIIAQQAVIVPEEEKIGLEIRYEGQTQRYNRETLYQEVWEEPMTVVSKRYALSPTGEALDHPEHQTQVPSDELLPCGSVPPAGPEEQFPGALRVQGGEPRGVHTADLYFSLHKTNLPCGLNLSAGEGDLFIWVVLRAIREKGGA